MPIVRHFPKEKGYESLTVWRYWCECLYPTHILELVEDGDQLELCIYEKPGPSFWKRIVLAWSVLCGGETLNGGIVINSKNREEIVAVLKKEIIPG